MRTEFTLAQLADPDTAASEKILRACVHCGFCTATCPTYVLLGDELDSPRGRIYLIKNMLEGSEPIGVETVKHIDRCLSCLACMTTCPSGVNYMHLVDHGRRHIEAHYRRPWAERLLRYSLGRVLTRPRLMRAALHAARLAKPFAALLPKPLRPLLELAPSTLPAPSPVDRPQIFPAQGERRIRVALLPGCAQQVLMPEINEATIRLLTRHGAELAGAGFTVVDVPEGHLCCGSAGTYNLLQPELASALRDRKLANIALTGADLLAAGNIGCITQLAADAPVPVVHTAELLDWATGGPMPRALARRSANDARTAGSAATGLAPPPR